MNGFIYVIKNHINHKIYVGQTRVSIATRWKEHIRHASYGKLLINRAMRKYGVANFYIEPLETCPIENLDAKEVYYIKVFDSTNKTKGYNVSLGGGGTPKFRRPALDALELKRLYVEERLPLEQIASMYKVTRYRITVALHEASVKIRTRWESNTKTTRISKEVIIEALNNEGSLRKAAKYLGITYNTYRSTCIQYHIEYNSSKSVRQ